VVLWSGGSVVGGPSCDGKKCACCARRRSFAVCSCGSACSCVGTHGTDWFGLWSVHFSPYGTAQKSAHGTVTQPRQPLVLLLIPVRSSSVFFHRRTRPLRVACFAVFRVCHGHPRPLRASARVLSS
jgi:hypothetical protein